MNIMDLYLRKKELQGRLKAHSVYQCICDKEEKAEMEKEIKEVYNKDMEMLIEYDAILNRLYSALATTYIDVGKLHISLSTAEEYMKLTDEITELGYLPAPLFPPPPVQMEFHPSLTVLRKKSKGRIAGVEDSDEVVVNPFHLTKDIGTDELFSLIYKIKSAYYKALVGTEV